MAATRQSDQRVAFDFDFYKFNGRGNAPTLVPSVQDANFMRSRSSVDESLIDVAIGRVLAWASDNGLCVAPRKPFPSSRPGKYWIEFRFGGLTL